MSDIATCNAVIGFLSKLCKPINSFFSGLEFLLSLIIPICSIRSSLKEHWSNFMCRFLNLNVKKNLKFRLESDVNGATVYIKNNSTRPRT